MIPIFPKYIFIDDSTLTYKSMNNVLRSEMDVGPQKTRPIQSNPMTQYNFSASICDDKFSEWITWFRSDIAYGAKWFRMNNPLFGENERFRFVETEIEWVKNGNLFRSTFTIESY